MGWLKYPWLLGKLFALVFIFVGGGVLATLVTPVVLLAKQDRQKRTQDLVQLMFRLYLWLLQVTQLIVLRVECVEALRTSKGTIIVANHPSLLDVVVLMAYIPRAQWIIKHELWNHRFLGCLMRSAGYIRNDLEPEALMASCQRALAAGRCLIIFPEGTRTPLGKTPRFQRGFANIAFLMQAPVQAIAITCAPAVLYKGEPWWKVPLKQPVFCFLLGPSLDKGFYLRYKQRSIAVRRLVEYLESYYRKFLPHG